ncbi:zinc finger protein 708-like [Centruroides sculpturatus]|uniref:zinc finger protein 708-like n=1 Tax=Centruroides sculpturatus TaxID=218467 RepID=UPI000C6E92C9|nr:zinc finger protein 708-like [Centruroides sculpturatus]
MPYIVSNWTNFLFVFYFRTGEKQYKCDKAGCGKSFARNEELTRHKKIHSGIKSYVCHACSKGFGRKDHLTKHQKTHLKASEKKMHKCYIVGCNHEYTRSDALARHLSNAHDIKSNSSKSRAKTTFLPTLPAYPINPHRNVYAVL